MKPHSSQETTRSQMGTWALPFSIFSPWINLACLDWCVCPTTNVMRPAAFKQSSTKNSKPTGEQFPGKWCQHPKVKPKAPHTSFNCCSTQSILCFLNANLVAKTICPLDLYSSKITPQFCFSIPDFLRVRRAEGCACTHRKWIPCRDLTAWDKVLDMDFLSLCPPGKQQELVELICLHAPHSVFIT